MPQDDPGFTKLKTSLKKFRKRNPGLSLALKGVTLTSDKTGKTLFDYIACASEFFKRIQKGSSYYRRILLIHKPRGTTTDKTNMEKRLGVNLGQGYVNRVMTMPNSGMIPLGNCDIIHRLLFGKTRPGEEIWTWKNKSWTAIINSAAKS